MADVSNTESINEHRGMRDWYKRYMAIDPDDISPESDVIRELESDKLDYDQIQFEVQQLVASADVLRGFCAQCRWLLGHWPSALERDGAPIWACAFGRAVNTREMEAAARAGCKFCMFLLSRLINKSMLDTFRKVEMRFGSLGKSGAATLSIQLFGTGQDSSFIWLNLPGKTASHYHANGARMCKIVSEIVSPTSEYLYCLPPIRAHFPNAYMVS